MRNLSKSKNRSRVEILGNILTVAKGGAKKTHLMYKSNLSFTQLHLYLDFLIQQELIGEDIQGDAKLFCTTAKGLEFLRHFDMLNQLTADLSQAP